MLHNIAFPVSFVRKSGARLEVTWETLEAFTKYFTVSLFCSDPICFLSPQNQPNGRKQ